MFFTPPGRAGQGGNKVSNLTIRGAGYHDAGIAFWASTGLTSNPSYPQSLHAGNPDFRFSKAHSDRVKDVEARQRPSVLRTEAFGHEPGGRCASKRVSVRA